MIVMYQNNNQTREDVMIITHKKLNAVIEFP